VKRAEPGDWRTYWFLGAAGVVSGRDSLVESSFRRVTELSNTNPDGWVYLSSHYLEKENFQEAVTVLERAIKILPEEFRIHFFLGVAYNRLGRLDDAVRLLERARSINRKDVGAMSQLALVYDGMKRHEESDKLYEEALAIEPENSVVLNNFSYSLAERSIQLDRALRMSQKAVEADPENSAYLDTFGWIYYRLGRYDEAERYVRMAIERGGASAVVYEHLGDIYYKQNEVERAMEQWNIALKMDESNASLRGKISRGSL
jgi:tetratricopeptide (TPR) repeat protein